MLQHSKINEINHYTQNFRFFATLRMTIYILSKLLKHPLIFRFCNFLCKFLIAQAGMPVLHEC